MKPFFISSLRLPVVMFAGLTTLLASSSNLAFATPIIVLDTQSGFIGTNDNDTLVGLGLFDVSADAIALGVDITLLGSGKFDNFVLADAQAHGIDALAGEDLVFISDLLTTTATATAEGLAAAGSLTGDASADISVNAMAESTGVDGGDDGDSINNANSISSNAAADATAVEVVLMIDGGLNSNADAGDALVEAGTRSDANATAITGGSGADQINNNASLSASADATTTSVTAGLSIALGANANVSTGAALSDGSSISTALVTGIDAGDGDDTVNSNGEIVLDSSASATGVALSLDVGGSLSGNVATGESMSNSRTQADSLGIGIAGGSGSDYLLSSGPIGIASVSTATAFSGSLSLAVSQEGNVVSGGGVSDLSTSAMSQATAIDAGDGDDTIIALSTASPGIDLNADANATGVAVTLDITGSVEGSAAGGAALSNARTDAEALATGLSAGGGNDQITNVTGINATTSATATAVSLGLSVGVSVDGDVTSGAAVSDASSLAVTQATGIDGGAGDDTIDNVAAGDDIIALSATSNANGVAASFSVAGSVKGDASVGDALSEARTDADAAATGIAGGIGSDIVTSTTGIDASSAANATAVSVDGSVGVTVDGDVSAGAAVSDASSLASTRSIGIDGGADDDTIGGEDGITGGITASADSTAIGVAASFSVAGSAEGTAQSGDALSEARTDADAEAAGIGGGTGGDTITSATDIDATATSTATAVSGAFSVGVSVDGDVTAGTAVSDASSLAATQATGIDGGEGNDTITSTTGEDGAITLLADANATGVAASFNVAGSVSGAATAGDALSEARTDADAQATGIAGGTGVDTILSNTAINATADSDATAVSAGISVGISQEGDVSAGAAVSDASSLATTRAVGIDGGADDDTIGGEDGITGGINLVADSAATAVSASFSVAGSVEGNAAAGDALSEARTDADAEAIGIAGGTGGDTISSATAIDADAVSTTTSFAASVSVEITKEGDTAGQVSGGKSVSDASSLATTRAVGIDGGADNDTIGGDDGITGGITSTATSTANGVAASFSVAGSAEGAAEAGAALSEARTDADAEAAGIGGGTGSDTITSATDIDATATSTATAVSIDASVGVTVDGDVTAGAAVSDASSLATTRSTGIDGGEGDDRITSTTGEDGAITLQANSIATGVAASFTVAGSASGAATAGDALSEARTDADAQATGIAGGTGVDTILSNTSINATADSEATAVSADFSVSISAEGDVSAGAAVSDASSFAIAQAAGIDGGADGDTIGGEEGITGGVTVRADSTATGVSASFSVAGSAEGNAASGAALSETRSDAVAGATAIAGGDGDDIIRSATGIDSDAVSTTVAVGVSISAEIKKSGDSEGTVTGAAALSDASSLAVARSTGIDGGDGVDEITSAATGDVIDVYAESSSTSVAASVVVSGRMEGGIEGGGAVSEASTTADAQAVGIDSGDGGGSIDNQTAIVADTVATSAAVGVGVDVGITGDGNVQSAALSNASSLAVADSTGIAAGDGIDNITNSGELSALADSSATGVAASVTVAGTASGNVATQTVSDATVVAESRATGIDGGAGDDTIDNEGDIRLMDVDEDADDDDADAEAISVAVSLDVSGSLEGDVAGDALSNASATASASATGIDGGSGIDDIDNSGRIVSDVGAETVSAAVTIDVGGTVGGDATGAALSDASATAIAQAGGIDGGDGVDDIDNSGELDLRARTDAVGVAVSVTVAGTMDGNAASRAVSDASVTAESDVAGISGGTGGDTITNTGAIRLMDNGGDDAVATAVAVSLNVSGSLNGNVDGQALSDSSATANASAVGIDGGAGIDSIDNQADIFADVGAETVSVGASIGVGITAEGDATGAALSDTSAESVASASGIDGGDDGDDIDNLANIDIRTDAESEATAVSVSIAGSLGGIAEGNAASDASATSIAQSTGIEGGGGDDLIDTTGQTFDDANQFDVEPNEYSIYSFAGSDADADAVTVAGAGSIGAANAAALADASANGSSIATGIGGGDGDDTIDNASKIDAVTNTNATANSTSVTVAIGLGSTDSAGIGDSSATATSTAIGIAGGDGGDTITNSATLLAGQTSDFTMSKAQAGSTSVDVGITLGDAESETSASAAALAEATAAAIGGGSGDDTIFNSGTVIAGTAADVYETNVAPQAIALAGSQTVKVGVTLGDADSQSSSDSSSTAITDIAAISGGEGADTITNTGFISSVSSAEAKSESKTTSVELSFGASQGSASANATSQATAISAGLDGGSGDDTIVTGGELYSAAESRANAESASLSLAVLAIGESDQSAAAFGSSSADANARGIYGNAGNDTVDASGTIRVAANADVTSDIEAAVNAGFGIGSFTQNAQSQADTTARSLAVGIDGGTGNDSITDTAIIEVLSTAYAASTAESTTDSGFNLAGSSTGESMSDARATVSATGVAIRGGEQTLADGGSDNDTIMVTDVATVTATSTGISTSTADTSAGTVFGSAEGRAVSDASAVVRAKGVGIEGGAGDDTITTGKVVEEEDVVSQGDFAVSANAETEVKSTSTVEGDVTFGNASVMGASDASVDMASEAFGIDAGSGADTVMIDSKIDVDAISNGAVTSTSNANADTTFGDASSGAMSDASAMRKAQATGILGGGGNDDIDTSADARISVTASSSGSVTSKSNANADTTFGDAASNTITAASSEGIAETFGITGGDDHDIIRNLGNLVSTAEAELTIKSTSISITASTFGDTFAGATSDTSIAGRALSKGITGDAGADLIETQGSLTVNGSVETIVEVVTVALADSTFGSANTVAGSRNSSRGEVVAAGIEGGEGDDTITAGGQIAVAGASDVTVESLTVSGSGPASSDAQTLATADVSGIDGGDGDDDISGTGEILVAAAPHVGYANRIYGSNVDGNVGIELQAEAAGIDGGDGQDSITNDGDLLVIVGRQSDANTTDQATGGSDRLEVALPPGVTADEVEGKWVRFNPDDEPVFFTVVESYDPDTGEMTLRDPIPVDLVADTSYTLFDVDSASADIELSEVTIGGRVQVDAATEGNVTASGISGGAGDDEIMNNGNVEVKASNFTKAGDRTVSGNIQSDLSTRSNVFGIGIDGDALDLEVTGGADVLKNFGDVSVEAASSIDFGASRLLYYGQSSIDAAGEAQATAIGLRGGEMNDTVVHSGNLYITSEALILAEEKSETRFSDIEQQLDFAASGESVGISAGDGDDVVMSSGNVEVSSTAQGSVIGSTTTIESFFNIFLGIDEPRTENIVNVSLDGTGRGLDLGAGADVVENTGDLMVLALAVPVGADEYVALAISEGNETGARATAVNTAVATGIGGDSGTHQVTNSGVIDVGAESVATSFAQAAEVLTADDQSTITSIDQPDQFVDEALAGTELNFTGKELRLTGSDDGFTRLDSNVTAVDSDLAANQFEDSTATSVDPDSVIGTRIRFESDNPDVAEFESVVTGYEVVADNGGTTAVFTLEDPLPTDNGNDLVAVEDAYRLSVLTATVTQFDAASGTFTLNEVVPDGATNEAYTLSVVSSDATLGPNSHTFVDISRQDEEAGDFVGNWVSFPNAPAGFAARVDGFDSQTGTFTLTCVERCEEFDEFDVVAGDIYELSLTRDGTSGSDAAANAYGIDLRGGDASITNSGEILVIATADASTEVNVSFGTENASADATAVAFGIRTGNGNDTITNEEAATISVVAEAMSETNTGEQSTSATATGIETGAGDDVVTNNGLISALTVTNGVATSDTGIDLGAGDDALTLGDGSEVIGTVTLGDDNDSLTLVGTPIVRDASGASINPQAGAGIDALILEGAGAFAGVPVGFEHATKTGTGTYALPQLATLDSLTIEEGMLQLGSDYDFAVDGQFSTYFHSDGDHGRLSVDGDSVLNGAINVEKRGNTYISNGSRYSLVQTTGTLNNAFADVTLPASTPLLSYDLEQTVNSIDTVVTAASFSTATDNPLYRQIARNLDSIADDASGDMAFVLGTLQSLESGFDQAFASASPDSHLVTTQTTVATGQQAARLLQNHMASSRAVYRQSIQGQSASGNVSFAYNNGVGAIGLSTTPKVTGHKDTRLMLAANEYSDTGVGQTLPRQIDIWGKKLIFSDTVESEPLPLQTKAKSQAWIQGGKAYGDYDEIDGYTGFETDSNILALGYDFRLNERFIIGGTLGYAKTDLDMSTASANGQIEAWSGGAYANWFNDKAYLDGGIVYANQSYDTQRAVVVGSISRTATSQHDGSVWMGFLGSGYQFDSDSWFFEPYGSLYYFNVKEDGFTETGAGSLNQTIEGRTTEALIGELGANAAWLQKLGKGMLDLHGTLGLNYDFNIDDARISYSYAGAPGDVFIIDDRNLERNSAVFGAGVSYTSGNSSFSLDYRRLQNNDFNNDSIFAGLEVRF